VSDRHQLLAGVIAHTAPQKGQRGQVVAATAVAAAAAAAAAAGVDADDLILEIDDAAQELAQEVRWVDARDKLGGNVARRVEKACTAQAEQELAHDGRVRRSRIELDAVVAWPLLLHAQESVAQDVQECDPLFVSKRRTGALGVVSHELVEPLRHDAAEREGWRATAFFLSLPLLPVCIYFSKRSRTLLPQPRQQRGFNNVQKSRTRQGLSQAHSSTSTSTSTDHGEAKKTKKANEQQGLEWHKKQWQRKN
jgi:hypothetical protein